MKITLVAAILSIFTTLSAQAAFVCDYNYRSEGQLAIPSVLPGPGQIFWGEVGAEEVSCRNK